MASAVLDSFAVLAFLFGEPGHEKVLTLLENAADADTELLIAGPNWAEVRYIVERRVGLTQWREARARRPRWRFGLVAGLLLLSFISHFQLPFCAGNYDSTKVCA